MPVVHADNFKLSTIPNVKLFGRIKLEYVPILSESAQAFLVALHQNFSKDLYALLHMRASNQDARDRGSFPTVPTETSHIRHDTTWGGPLPGPGLEDRRVEITGPVDRKTVINALNSGATHFMADFEDSTSPTWENCMDGQVNLRDAIKRTINFVHPETGKTYKLGPTPAVLSMRPRGLHLVEQHFWVDGAPISAALFDFGLYFYHNALSLIQLGHGPYFYLAKLEAYSEAEWWSKIFSYSEKYVSIPNFSIRATILIETISAAFQMEEMLFYLRDYSSGLNFGRWDYIYSIIKMFSAHRQFIFPDRKLVTMELPFIQTCEKLLIQTCHRRKVHAIGGMAAQIPIKEDEQANQVALNKVHEDKVREVKAGYDGTWVAHPALIPMVKDIFDKFMPHPNQISSSKHGLVVINATELLEMTNLPKDSITIGGVCENVAVALKYIEAWLRGIGCVAMNNLMEDTATAEISRSQLWQWVHYKCSTNTGEKIDMELVSKLVDKELESLKEKTIASSANAWEESKYLTAKKYLLKLVESPTFIDFFTKLCYDEIVSEAAAKRVR